MEILFGRRRIIPPEISTTVQSAEFAKEVLDLEESMSIAPCAEKVRRLIELYTEAISYYNYIGDAKHKHYQQKMHGILSRKDLLCFLGDPGCAKPKEKQKQKQLTNELIHERSADKALKEHMEVVSEFSPKVFENLHNQCKGLFERIKRRKTARKGPDIGGGNPRISFEEALEAVIEKYSDRKDEVKRKIQEIYSNEIRGALGHPENSDSVEDMNDRMKSQINRELANLEQEKKNEIKRLRESYHI